MQRVFTSVSVLIAPHEVAFAKIGKRAVRVLSAFMEVRNPGIRK